MLSRAVVVVAVALVGALAGLAAPAWAAVAPGGGTVEEEVWVTLPDGSPLTDDGLFSAEPIVPGDVRTSSIVLHRRGDVDGRVQLRVVPVDPSNPLEKDLVLTARTADATASAHLDQLLRDGATLELTPALDVDSLRIDVALELPLGARATSRDQSVEFGLVLMAYEAEVLLTGPTAGAVASGPLAGTGADPLGLLAAAAIAVGAGLALVSRRARDGRERGRSTLSR